MHNSPCRKEMLILHNLNYDIWVPATWEFRQRSELQWQKKREAKSHKTIHSIIYSKLLSIKHRFQLNDVHILNSPNSNSRYFQLNDVHTRNSPNSNSRYSLINDRWSRWKVVSSGAVLRFCEFLPVNRTSSRSSEKCGSCVVRPNIICIGTQQ